MLRKVSGSGFVTGAHAVPRSRGTDVEEKTGVKLLDVEQLRHVSLNDLESVLNGALQDAVDDSNWSDHLLHYARLFDQLQNDKEWPDGFIVARALRDGLLQALDQRSASTMSLDEVSRRASIEQRLDEGPIGRFGRALRTGDLPAAVACVHDMQALNEALALEMASDVVEALTIKLAQADLTVGWTTLETRPLFEDRTTDLPRQFDVVLRALSVLQCLNMAPSLPLASSCQRWLLEHLPTDGVKPAVLGLLSDAREDQALRSAVMDLFEQALCSPSAQPAEVEWLILHYAEHIDLVDVLGPIRAPADPKALPLSGFDRLLTLARKLNLPSYRERAGAARQDAWRPGWAVLLDLSQYLFEREGEVDFDGMNEEGTPVPPRRQLFGYLRSQLRSKAAGIEDLVLGMWVCSASNGLSTPYDGTLLLKWQFARSYEKTALLPFWESPLWERLLAALAPHAVKGLSEPKQQALLRRNLMGILLRCSPHLIMVAAELVDEQRFAQGPDWATASVEACLQWADQVCAGVSKEDSKGLDLARLWRSFGAQHPDWLDSMKTPYPWVGRAIDEFEQGVKEGYNANAIISKGLRGQLIKKA
jgi:hypothetical protein